MAVGVVLSEEVLGQLKHEVLKEKIDEISQQLGDPGRYFPSFKAKGMLDANDCELIKARHTSVERVLMLLEVVCSRVGKHGEHPYDVFVDALRKMKVHVHISRILNKELSKKREDKLKTQRAKQALLQDQMPATLDQPQDQSGPSPTLPVPPLQNGLEPELKSRCILSSGSSISTNKTSPSSTTSTPNSSILSPSSAFNHTPSASSLSDSLREFEVDPSIGPMPNLPSGYDAAGKLSHQTSVNSTASSAGPLPALPSGYDSSGKKFPSRGASNRMVSPPEAGYGQYNRSISGEEYHHRISSSGVSIVSDDIFATPGRSVSNGEDLDMKCKMLTDENLELKLRLKEAEANLLSARNELKEKEQRNQKLNKKLKHLESQLNLMQSAAQPTINIGHQVRLVSPHGQRYSDGNLFAGGSNDYRVAEQWRRGSELKVPSPHSRPTNLPLHMSRDNERGPVLSMPERHFRVTPSSDCSRDGYTPQSSRLYHASSQEDLLSDDVGSVRSGSSRTSADLSSLGNTHSTMV